MKRHLESARVRTVGSDDGFEYPGRVVTPVELPAFESDPATWLVHGAHHPKPFRAGQRTDPSPQLHQPGRTFIVVRELRSARPAGTIVSHAG